jgi:hypothetical protein
MLIGVRGVCFYLPTWTQRQWNEADAAATADPSTSSIEGERIRQSYYDRWMSMEADQGVVKMKEAFQILASLSSS